MAPLLSSVAAKLRGLLRAFLLWVLSAGPIPAHIAIIMDGNRRFADRLRMDRRIGHSHGYESLMRTLKDCFDLRVKTVTLYAFSIDNFKRPPEEVSALMDLMQTKLETLIEKEDLVREYGVRVRVLGDLSLLPDGVRKAAERAMAVTSQNSSAVLNLCISYTSTHEIVHSVQRIRDDLVSVLGRGGDVDVSQSSMGICDFKENDWPMITCNGHALGSHMAWDDDVSNGDNGHANGSCKDVGNGDHGHANGSLQPCHNGVDNGDYEHANAFLKAWDDSVHNCNCVHVKGYCNAGDGDVGNGDHVHANGYCKEWDGALGNGENNGDYDRENVEREMRSQNSAGKIDSREIRSFGSTDCKSMQSNVLRNRIFKKAGLSGICNPEKSGFLQDGDQELTNTKISWDNLKICDCKDFGLLENCVNGSKKAFKNCYCMGTGSSGDIDCDVVGKSRASGLNKAWHAVDCKCKTNGPKKASNGLRNCDIFNSPNKLAGLRQRLCEFTDSCPHVGLSTDGILENGLPMSCKCGQQCHIDDRILKLVKDRISEEEIEKHLYTDSCPPPDILIRTSGETRLSNFLLWQASFSHLAFSKVLWPEFSFRHLFFIILEYQRAHPSLLRKRQWCTKAS